jgi:hypothetical protein
MLTLLALLAALLGPGPILADNSGGGPVAKAVVAGNTVGGTPAATPTSTDVGGGGLPITVDDNSGGGPVNLK